VPASHFVFTLNSKPIKSIRGIFVKVCGKADVEDFTFHDFRHTFVTRKRREGHGSAWVAELADARDLKSLGA
jgi:integrase